MLNTQITNTLLFGTQGVVFALLAFILFQFYKGYGRQYVWLWMMSCLGLSLSNFSEMFLSANIASLPSQLLNISLSFSYQFFSFIFLLFFSLGLYSAIREHQFKQRTLQVSSLLVLMVSLGVSLIYTADASASVQRFYFRVSLHEFAFALVFFAMSIFISSSEKKFFSLRIMQPIVLLAAIRFSLVSVFSVVLTKNDTLHLALAILPYIDAALFTCLGVCSIIWMLGAERHIINVAMNKIKYLGRHDALTGALNREQLLQNLPKIMEQAKQKKQRLSLYLIDLKRFKFINDTYGLKVGDHVLGEIASRLAGSLLKPKLVGRLSGDSFAYILDHAHDEESDKVLTHIHSLVERAVNCDGQEIHLSCSIGYCYFPEHSKQAEDLLHKANLALFHAENTFKPSVGYSEGMQVEGRHLISVEKSIRKAIADKEFVLYFQPQLNLISNRLEGVEALLRWQHPEKGLLAPAAFLPDVDALGLSAEIDAMVLELACQSAAKWYNEYKRRITIAVNLSAMEFQNPRLIPRITKLLEEYQITPKNLELEITENLVMTDIQSAMDTIVSLQNMGIKVSIDDFGTGYSSLSYLRQLPIDKIKIDRSFVLEMTNNDSDLTIVKSMVDLAHGLGKRVLAEGVETQDQLNILRAINCDAVQGYYISKPQPHQEIQRYFSTQTKSA